MSHQFIRILSGVAAFTLAASLSGCGASTSVSYVVEGSGTADITYTSGKDEQTAKGATLPWTMDAKAGSGSALDLVVENASTPEGLSCSITRDGKVTNTAEADSAGREHCYDYGN